MQQSQPFSFQVRAAQPTDIPALMRLKRLLAEGENAQHAVRATETHWRRDGFGPNAGFCAFVAEDGDHIIGMATCSKRVVTGWNGPVVFLQDMFVEVDRRQRGVAHALMMRVAAYAREVGSPIVEFTVRSDNPAAQAFYRQAGCMPLPECLTYVLAGPSLTALADQDKANPALAV
jgi:ribosomal protein S18 acetylase RimI-like enzyme